MQVHVRIHRYERRVSGTIPLWLYRHFCQAFQNTCIPHGKSGLLYDTILVSYAACLVPPAAVMQAKVVKLGLHRVKRCLRPAPLFSRTLDIRATQMFAHLMGIG